ARERGVAEAATRDARRAGEKVSEALARAENALDTARAEQARAQAEADRAEANLATARQAVDHVLRTIKASQADDPELYRLHRELLVGVGPFLSDFLRQRQSDRKIREDQAEVAMRLGELERHFGNPAPARD